MRWKLTTWFAVTVITVTCAQIVTINSHLPPYQAKLEQGDNVQVKEFESKESNNESGLTSSNINNVDQKTLDENDNENSEIKIIERLESEENIDGASIESGENADLSDNVDGSNEIVTNESDDESTTEQVSSEEMELTEGDIVTTQYGPVHGYIKEENLGIQRFLDIPYGKFNEPFEAPTEPDSWESIRNISIQTKHCPQLLPPDIYTGDLDCLTLSVFTPPEAENASVLFHIHDGNFISGRGDPSTYGPNYLVSKGVILVLPNYRLGVLGFLCLQNETAPGNAALKDLTLALNWTKQNIEAFGGNPSNIVVSGDGTAGALAGYLALSVTSKDYVSKVITESGSVLSHWALDREPIIKAESLAEKIRDSQETHSTNVFQETDLPIVIKAAKDMTFRPCIETENYQNFLTQTPWKILQDDNIKIPFMIGSANHAGMQEALRHTADSIAELNENFQNMLPDDLKFDGEIQKSEIAEEVKDQYFNGQNVSLDKVEELSLCYTDVSYLSPGIRGARPLVKAGTTVFFYEFAYIGKLSRHFISMREQIQGAARGDIVGYVFSKDGDELDQDSDDAHMVALMTDLWITFINTGKPTAENINWDELKTAEEAEEEWLLIDSEPKLQQGLHLNRLELWTNIYEKHFIEHNLAFEYKPRVYSFAVSAIIFYLGSRRKC